MALTIRQFLLMNEGFKRTVEVERIKTIDSWKQTRMISFFLVQDRLKDKSMTMYEFLPLPGDPTKEEMKEAEKIQHEKDAEWMLETIRRNKEARRKLKVA